MLIKRYEDNPILKPKSNHLWESRAVFNGCPVRNKDGISLLYRALSLPYYSVLAGTTLPVSSIGIARSEDGLHFSNRRRFITPEFSWERFGCEDPRVTRYNNKYYIFYTALSSWPPAADGIKVGLAISPDLRRIREKHQVTPFNAKAMALFPYKINGKIYTILSVNTDKPPASICLASFNQIEDIWSEHYWADWYRSYQEYSLPLRRSPDDHVEVGAPPLRTKDGWLLVYSYISNYFSGSKERLFGIEAALLDLENPFLILGKTEAPVFIPEEYYETIGLVPNIVFPSGALVRGKRLHIYYGAADTTCCTASVRLSTLSGVMLNKKPLLKLKRAEENPVILPVKEHPWESKATFNPAALYLDNKVHIVYRAMSEDNTSIFGYAVSTDGIHIDYRSEEPVYTPREPFEQKLVPGSNSGCEDPRLTLIGNRIYMLYTAYDGKNPPRVATTFINTRDFLSQRWNWSKPILITPPQYDNKDAFVFPEKLNNQHICVHRLGNDIDYDYCTNLDRSLTGNFWLNEHHWIAPRKGWWDSVKVGAAAPPVKTNQGWVMLYHGVSEDNIYRVGALLLDLKNPVKVISRTYFPIFEPEAPYEKEGQVLNVVFPCGNVIIDNTLYVYYGGGDSVVGVATVEIKDILKVLQLCKP